MFSYCPNDNSPIVPPKGCLDESFQLPTCPYMSKRSCVSLNIDDVLSTVKAAIFLARRILFEIARLKRSIFAVGPVKLSQEAYNVDVALTQMEKCLGKGEVSHHSEDVNGQDLVLKGPTLQKALCTAKKSFLDLEKAFNDTVLAELKTGMRWRDRGNVDYEKLLRVIIDLEREIRRIWDRFNTVYFGELEALKASNTQEDHADAS